MQTIIMTVGTSLLTNGDRHLPEDQKRPWLGKQTIGNRQQAVTWMEQQCNQDLASLENFSAETNTFYHLDPSKDDRIILLHSDTPKGLECAQLLQLFFASSLEQQHIQLQKLSGINYDSDESTSALEKMSQQVEELINQAQGNVTLAATDGFKAQTMIMAVLGNMLNVPVCYIHEEFQGLIYLPYIDSYGKVQNRIISANLAQSEVPRDQVIRIQQGKSHHRPRLWNKLERELPKIPWINRVRYDEKAFSAPRNGVRKSPQEVNIILIHIYEKQYTRIALAIDTTALTIQEQEQAAVELRQYLGNI